MPSTINANNTTGLVSTADTSGILQLQTNGTTAVTVDTSQRVGVGTSSPSSPLHVNGATGSVAFIVGNTTETTRLEVTATTNVGATLDITDAGNNRSMMFAISGTERARIDSSGNLLVGKTSADNSVAGVWVYNQSGTNARLNLAKTASGTTNGIANYHSGTYVGGVDYSNTATSFPTSSDIRLKKDIVDASSASTKIDQIRVVSHGWKHDDEIVEFGVIAQELYAIAPQAVNAGDDGEEIDKTWGVDYSKLVPILIKAHQEQQTLIESLTQRITTLEGAQP